MKKITLLFATLPLMLSGCGGNSVPKEGYKKFKESIALRYGNANAVSYNWCYYVYITGDGKMEAGSIKGTVYYKVNYTVLSLTSTTFVYYNSNANYVSENVSSYASAYEYAYSLVADGSLSGTRGKL